MNTTRRSLLRRVRDLDDHDAWDQFYELYAPLLYRFARRQLSAADAEEVRDQCLELLARKMPEFRYDPAAGRFKGWLYKVARSKIVDLHRRGRDWTAKSEELQALVDDSPTPIQVWEEQWRQEHLKYCLERARSFVPERSFVAFNMLMDDKSVPEVCAALSMNSNQVYKAKMAVLQRVRRILKTVGG